MSGQQQEKRKDNASCQKVVRRIFRTNEKGWGRFFRKWDSPTEKGSVYSFVPHLLEAEGESEASNDEDDEIRYFFFTTARPALFAQALSALPLSFVMTVRGSPTTLVYSLVQINNRGSFDEWGRIPEFSYLFRCGLFQHSKHYKRWYNRTHTGRCDLTSLPLWTNHLLSVKDCPIILYFPFVYHRRERRRWWDGVGLVRDERKDENPVRKNTSKK